MIIRWKGIIILKTIKDNNMNNFTMSELITELNKRKFKISKPTLSKYLDIFTAYNLLSKTESFVNLFNITNSITWEKIRMGVEIDKDSTMYEMRVLESNECRQKDLVL